MTLTTSGTLGVAAAAISLTSIPGTYKALMLWVSLRTAAATAYDDLILRVNGNTTAGDYRGQRHIIQAASYILENVGTVATLSNAYIVGNGAPAGAFAHLEFVFPNYASTAMTKTHDQ